MTSATIDQFQIRQLYEIYKFLINHRLQRQFAVAKKVRSGYCEWRINADFSRQGVNAEELPIEDVNSNCIFACVVEKWKGNFDKHTERLIDDYINLKGYDRRNYDLYTYLFPCQTCQEGFLQQGRLRILLESYNGIYYSHDKDKDDKPVYRSRKYLKEEKINQILPTDDNFLKGTRPDGDGLRALVSREWTYLKDGQPVSYGVDQSFIRDVEKWCKSIIDMNTRSNRNKGRSKARTMLSNLKRDMEFLYHTVSSCCKQRMTGQWACEAP